MGDRRVRFRRVTEFTRKELLVLADEVKSVETDGSSRTARHVVEVNSPRELSEQTDLHDEMGYDRVDRKPVPRLIGTVGRTKRLDLPTIAPTIALERPSHPIESREVDRTAKRQRKELIRDGERTFVRHDRIRVRQREG